MSGRSQARLAELEPREWDALLRRLGCADVYLESAYVEASCVLDPGRPVFLHHGDRGGDVVFCCIVRDVPGTLGRKHDVTTPYGYGGPVAVGREPPVPRFYELYDRWCGEQAIVSTFIRFHPLLANHRYAAERVRLAPLAGTITWQLAGGADLLPAMHPHHRRVLRKAQAAGVTVAVDTAPARLDDFAALYEETMRRVAAERFYFFPPAYWDALAGPLRERLVRFDAALSEELVASSLCFAAPPWFHYHLGATLEAARTVGAGHLLMYEAARWAQARGLEQFHLGGGVGGREDSLFEYKRRFAPHGRREAWIGKAVHDAESYLGLSGTDALDLAGFFPAYRARP